MMASASSNSRNDGFLNEVNSQNASFNGGSVKSAKGSISGDEGGRSNSKGRMGHGFPGGFSNVF